MGLEQFLKISINNIEQKAASQSKILVAKIYILFECFTTDARTSLCQKQ